MMAVLAGKLAARRSDCAPVAGKSTRKRLELGKLEPTRYHKISHNPVAIRNLLLDVFLEAHARAPKQIILDLDATDDPLHGEQEGRFFTATTIATVICRFMCSAGGICWSPSCGARTWTRRPARSRRWRASSPAFAPAGRRRAFCCAPIQASRGKTSWLGARPMA